MIRNKDNLETKNYTQKCSNVLIKLSNFSEDKEIGKKESDLFICNNQFTKKPNSEKNLSDSSKSSKKNISHTFKAEVKSPNNFFVQENNIPVNLKKDLKQSSCRKRSDNSPEFDSEKNNKKRVKKKMVLIRNPLIFCGPSGSGKSTLLKKLRNDFQDYFGFSISHTTRKPRNGETNGRDYYFVSREDILKAIQNDEFIEHTEFSGNIYGTSKKAIEDVKEIGKICILDIEMEGVKNIKKTDLDPVFIFVKPPSIDELKRRLCARGSETEESMKRRLKRAQDEIEFGEIKDNFDLLLVNDDFDATYEKLKNFVLKKYNLTENFVSTDETKK